MTSTGPSVFISYSHANKAFAMRLASDLKASGAAAWIDEAEINVGDSLIDKISKTIDRVDYLAAVLRE